MRESGISRRGLLRGSLVLPLLQGCATPLPPLSSSATRPEAQALLEASAVAHGSVALKGIDDLSVSYTGEWPPLIGSIQPALVDPGFRGGSEERLLLKAGLVAQAHSGPRGRKQVLRRWGSETQGEVEVRFNGEEARDAERQAAAALVADGYSLFLLGPMLLSGAWMRGRALLLEAAGTERITVNDTTHDCDVLRARLAPGLGFAPADRLALFIDRDERLMRRVRFTLEGLESTRGAVAEVDAWDHLAHHGIRWPTRFHERLLRPFPLPVHDWWLTGLDVNRGFAGPEIMGEAFTGLAAPPATSLAI